MCCMGGADPLQPVSIFLFLLCWGLCLTPSVDGNFGICEISLNLKIFVSFYNIQSIKYTFIEF